MQVAFELMGYIAVVTNCSLVALSPSVKEYARGYSDVQFTLFFVAAEVCTFSDIQDGPVLAPGSNVPMNRLLISALYICIVCLFTSFASHLYFFLYFFSYLSTPLSLFLIFAFSVLAKRLAVKSICEMTCFV